MVGNLSILKILANEILIGCHIRGFLGGQGFPLYQRSFFDLFRHAVVHYRSKEMTLYV